MFIGFLGCASEEGAQAPTAERRDCRAPVFFEPDGPFDVLAVVGDFNDWGHRARPLLDPDGDGVHAALINLDAPGLHAYRIWVDGVGRLDPYNPLTVFGHQGLEHSAARVEDCSQPAFSLEAFDRTGSGAVEAVVNFLRAESDAPLSAGSIEATLSPGEGAVEVEREGAKITLRATGLSPGKYALTIQAKDTEGIATESLRLPFWAASEPFDWRDALVYQVFVDRFRRGGGALDSDRSISFFHGGDLRGVIEAIEEGYFEEMGVNALWISPMYRNPEGQFTGRDGALAEAYHGYWPATAREVEPRFGGEAALDALIEAAHARGIRVIMDLVLNHVHVEHPYWSAHRSAGWFNNPDADCICGVTCSWGTNMQTCWFDPFLADLDWRNVGVVEQLVDDAVWWVERFDLDGLRVDAVPMMPRLALRHLRARLSARFEQAGEHVYLVGETYSFPGDQGALAYALGSHTLSGQFDFPVMWTLREAAAGRAPMTALDAEVLAGEAAWQGSGAVMAPFLGNHDVPRFISDVNGDAVWSPRTNPPATPTDARPYEQLKLAWTVVLTLPGAPVIYYGDELGLAGANDPDNRRDMRFEPDLSPWERDVKGRVERLGRARRCARALRRGARETLSVDASRYVYGRDAEDGYPAIVVVNAAATQTTVSITPPPAWSMAPDAGWVDVLGAPVTQGADGALTLSLGARSAALLLSDPRCLE